MSSSLAPLPLITVRNLGHADLPDVVRIDAEAGGRRRAAYFELMLMRALNFAGLQISLVAELDGRIAGYLVASLFYGEYGISEPTASIDAIAVAADARGRGVGRAMMEQFRANAVAIGVGVIRTEVAWDDFELLAFFKGENFARRSGSASSGRRLSPSVIPSVSEGPGRVWVARRPSTRSLAHARDDGGSVDLAYDTAVRRLIITALCALALPLAAAELRVASPRAGEVVRGGDSLTIEWSAGALPAHAEEWEAFLSIDGGRYYAFRVTPHLDLKLRRAQFVVPNVSTSRARILIRTGDERDEHAYELPWTFTIARSERAEPVSAAMATARTRGESARDGDPGVVAWAEGDRAGTRVAMQRGAAESLPALTTILRETSAPLANTKTMRAHHGARGHAPLDGVTLRMAIYRAQQTPPADLLLLCRRRNV